MFYSSTQVACSFIFCVHVFSFSLLVEFLFIARIRRQWLDTERWSVNESIVIFSSFPVCFSVLFCIFIGFVLLYAFFSFLSLSPSLERHVFKPVQIHKAKTNLLRLYCLFFLDKYQSGLSDLAATCHRMALFSSHENNRKDKVVPRSDWHSQCDFVPRTR